MHDSKANHFGVDLHGIFITGSALPRCIFENVFGQYLFFDADVCTSDALISILYKIAKARFGTTLKVDVFASSNRILLDRLDVNSNWIAQINRISKKLRTAGDCDGLILVDASHKWVVYQTRPVDIGVLAIDSIEGLSGLESGIADCFFECDNITNWLDGRSQRGLELVNNFGRDYLVSLVKNYGDASC